MWQSYSILKTHRNNKIGIFGSSYFNSVAMKKRIAARTQIMLFVFVLICTPQLMSQTLITGRITDCDHWTLKDASVVEVGTTNSVHAKKDGTYSISVSDTNAILEFSCPGYENQRKLVYSKRRPDHIKRKISVQLEAIHRNGNVKIGKPVIYLYPLVETEVSVQVAFNGTFHFTYPEYNNGWHVVASPSGRLHDKTDNTEYSYLFWEGKKEYTQEELVYESGYVVHKDSAVTFLQNILPKMGLKPNEYNEFIVYWAPYLIQNEWSFIHFRMGKDYDVISQNSVTPAPNTEIRIFMDFKKIDAPFDVKPQSISTPTRKGFTLVEWGGAELKQNITIKTATNTSIEK